MRTPPDEIWTYHDDSQDQWYVTLCNTSDRSARYLRATPAMLNAEKLVEALKDFGPGNCWCPPGRDVRDYGHSADCLKVQELIALCEEKPPCLK